MSWLCCDFPKLMVSLPLVYPILSVGITTWHVFQNILSLTCLNSCCFSKTFSFLSMALRVFITSWLALLVLNDVLHLLYVQHCIFLGFAFVCGFVSFILAVFLTLHATHPAPCKYTLNYLSDCTSGIELYFTPVCLNSLKMKLACL